MSSQYPDGYPHCRGGYLSIMCMIAIKVEHQDTGAADICPMARLRSCAFRQLGISLYVQNMTEKYIHADRIAEANRARVVY